MKHSWYKTAALIGLLTTFLLGSGIAEAKRMGGGRSMGKQSHNVSQKRDAQQSQPASTTSQQQSAQTTPKRNWGGMLGGLAAGLGLGMLLSHFGGGAMMNGLANMLMIAAVVMLGIWLLRRLFAAKRVNAQPAYAGGTPQFKMHTDFATDYTKNNFSSPATASGLNAATSQYSENSSIPKDFDADTFLRQAKVHFVRLQTAWDAGNTEDIREFTTPEMFAEIYADLAARDTNTQNQTDVITLEAQLLVIEQMGNHYLASVRFSGMLRESQNASPEPFVEIWNLTKEIAGNGGWVLAGIQQV